MTVSVRDGQSLVTDGPFAETREQLGGYNLIEADDLDDAIEIVNGMLGESNPVRIEVRRVMDVEEL